MSMPLLMFFAMAVEAVLGWPKALFRQIRHPVVWMGALIALLERKLNQRRRSHNTRRTLGAVTALAVVGITAMIAVLVERLLPDRGWGPVVEVLIASSLLATRSLYVHVAAVLAPLARSDLGEARKAVAHIVGRDPSALDAPAICRASIESLAENASDGVVAPLFWGALLGLPGLAAYKAVNTLDSMIGHRTDRYESFGWFSAKLDDAVNWLPARLTALAFLAAGMNARAAIVVWNDARRHRSRMPDGRKAHSPARRVFACRVRVSMRVCTRTNPGSMEDVRIRDRETSHARCVCTFLPCRLRRLCCWRHGRLAPDYE